MAQHNGVNSVLIDGLPAPAPEFVSADGARQRRRGAGGGATLDSVADVGSTNAHVGVMQAYWELATMWAASGAQAAGDIADDVLPDTLRTAGVLDQGREARARRAALRQRWAATPPLHRRVRAAAAAAWARHVVARYRRWSAPVSFEEGVGGGVARWRLEGRRCWAASRGRLLFLLVFLALGVGAIVALRAAVVYPGRGRVYYRAVEAGAGGAAVERRPYFEPSEALEPGSAHAAWMAALGAAPPLSRAELRAAEAVVPLVDVGPAVHVELAALSRALRAACLPVAIATGGGGKPCACMAAPLLGVHRRVIVVNQPASSAEPLLLLNPHIVHESSAQLRVRPIRNPLLPAADAAGNNGTAAAAEAAFELYPEYVTVEYTLLEPPAHGGSDGQQHWETALTRKTLENAAAVCLVASVRMFFTDEQQQ